jgi:predicted transcriptional regulator
VKTISVEVRLDKGTHARLTRLGECKDRPSDWLVRTAILQYLEHEETYEGERLEDSLRWQRYQASGECIDQGEMRQWLESLAQEAEGLAAKG